VTPNLDPGESEPYVISCSGPGGNRSETLTVTVPNIVVDTFAINPSLIRSGASSTVEWSLFLDNALTYRSGDDSPYSYPCDIFGALASQPFAFNAADNGGTGSTQTRVLTNRSIAALTCDSFASADAVVEVIPNSQEI
jgi:hypothetical protein